LDRIRSAFAGPIWSQSHVRTAAGPAERSSANRARLHTNHAHAVCGAAGDCSYGGRAQHISATAPRPGRGDDSQGSAVFTRHPALREEIRALSHTPGGAGEYQQSPVPAQALQGPDQRAGLQTPSSRRRADGIRSGNCRSDAGGRRRCWRADARRSSNHRVPEYGCTLRRSDEHNLRDRYPRSVERELHSVKWLRGRSNERWGAKLGADSEGNLYCRWPA
jgi:hypothetical protein